jgi:hypothetical protein
MGSSKYLDLELKCRKSPTVFGYKLNVQGSQVFKKIYEVFSSNGEYKIESHIHTVSPNNDSAITTQAITTHQ